MCAPFGYRDAAEYVLEHMPPHETPWRSVTADPFAGQPLTVKVPVSGRTSMSGRTLRRYQFQYLVVFAVLPDGRRVRKLVEIPDGRVSREVAVSLP